MKKIFFSFFIFLLIISTLFSSSAHKGRTDSNGGHYESDTGEYHYHHGYPAHQHVGGVCPYNFKDNTKQTEKSNNSFYTTTFNMEDINTETIYIIFICVAIVIVIIEFCIIMYNNERFRKEKNSLSHEVKTLKQNNEKKMAKLNELNETLSDLSSKIIKLEKEKYRTLCEEYELTIAETFNYKNIHEIIPLIPPSTYFVNESGRYLPCDSKRPGKYGSYTGYRSEHGCAFHFIRGCSGAYIETNFIRFGAYGDYFCSKCFKYQTDEMQYCDLWGSDFKKLMNLTQGKNIIIDFSSNDSEEKNS